MNVNGAALAAQIERDGFAIVADVLNADEVGELLCDPALNASRSPQESAGTRNLLRAAPSVSRLACGENLRTLVEPVLGAGAFAVRAILFDKTPQTNWKVAWHQDLTIAVQSRPHGDVPGFGPWSRKTDIDHVQPPAEILHTMLTLRVHLDDCDESNGALKVIPARTREAA